MTEEHQLPSDSDEDDEDYVPDGADDEPVSEVESEGDAESGPEDENDENKRESTKRKGRKRNKTTKSKTKKHRRTGIKLKDEADDKEDKGEGNEKSEKKKELTEEEEKKRADSLWADFMKDTEAAPKPKAETTTNKPKEKSPLIEKPKVEEKVKITKVFEFAGEEVKIEKEVSADSAEARLSLSTADNSEKTGNTASPAGKGSGRGKGFKRAGLGENFCLRLINQSEKEEHETQQKVNIPHQFVQYGVPIITTRNTSKNIATIK
ncbi:PREDICTED: craniofacial development protein 1 isoform X2 [Habropoda laboriosa]|uniref:craniofacial development protein 1 isoform X2 n=1 Tax=Habropoda laboriosa TaxID=597456 RepID=UPI00083D9F6D|nr:PREDICTED: craniofacial development protein 1 isoform X2 [Habropoda laboriosa]